MTPLRIARLGLLASFGMYVLGLAVATVEPGDGLLALIGGVGLPVTAFACVSIQLVKLIRSCLKPVEKPD